VKVALAAVSLLLAASMGGGFLLLPLLIPLHLWAARRSGRVGRVGWSLLPALAVGMVVWASVYTAVGEAKPAIWLVPVLASALALAVLPSLTRPTTRSHPARFSPAPRR
jgi:hypothetical protein